LLQYLVCEWLANMAQASFFERSIQLTTDQPAWQHFRQA
jgi:hypothetical protein